MCLLTPKPVPTKHINFVLGRVLLSHLLKSGLSPKIVANCREHEVAMFKITIPAEAEGQIYVTNMLTRDWSPCWRDSVVVWLSLILSGYYPTCHSQPTAGITTTSHTFYQRSLSTVWWSCCGPPHVRLRGACSSQTDIKWGEIYSGLVCINQGVVGVLLTSRTNRL